MTSFLVAISYKKLYWRYGVVYENCGNGWVFNTYSLVYCLRKINIKMV
jgi:hypothetical protein